MNSVPIGEVWRRYEPPGPVAKDFLINPERVSNLVGPYGSGKTTANFMRGLLQSTCVPPSPLDGVRYAKGVVINDTYTNLDKTTIASFKINFPDEWGTWTGGGGGPAISRINFALDDGTMLQQEIIFAAIGDTNVRTFTDGFEATWAFLNGVSKMPEDIIKFLYGRLGRWPPPMHRPADWRDYTRAHKRLSCDDNAPDISNWTYSYFWKDHRARLFLQPGAMFADGTLNPQAENLQNLDPDYYNDLMEENAKSGKWWARRYVMNKCGFSREGTPVYESWDDERHVAPKKLKFDPSRPLLLGFDAGRNPALVAGQRSFMGALRVLGEFIPGRMGALRFGKLASQWLAEKFPNADIGGAWADPTALNPTQDTDDDALDRDEGLWLNTVADACAIEIAPAPTNLFTPRYEAVNELLTDFPDGTPMYQQDAECLVLQEGFNGGYRYGDTKTHGDKVSTDRPIKNNFSNPHDALQYLALGSGDYRALLQRDGRASNRTTVVETMDG